LDKGFTVIAKILTLLALSIFSLSTFAQDKEIISKLINSKLVVDEQAKMVEKSMSENRPLSGGEISQLNDAATARLLLRDEAYAFFSKDFYLVDHRVKKDFKISETELAELMKSLSVAVTLYDTTLYTYLKFHDNAKIRRMLNEKDSSYHREGNTFENTIRQLFKFRNSIQLQRALKLYKNEYIANKKLNDVPDLQTTALIINESYLFNKFNDRKLGGAINDFFYVVGAKIKIESKMKYDLLGYMASSILYHGSKLFGNIAGSFQKRRGKLYHDPAYLSNVLGEMKPMDMLLEKTPFRLTDNFIPGFWGHAAIYIGTQEDLEELGIWDNELVQKYATEIEKGKFIVEALRDKVQMNTLNHFSDIDDFALLRSRVPMSKQKLAEHILRALSHVGKKYDFSFDVETGDTIVCSELHYRTYVDLKFNTTPYIGRSTISVDQVAEQAVKGMPYEPIILYLDGEEVDSSEIQEKFDGLLPKPEFSTESVTIQEAG
jgi:Permuted papain-like amidase enzyme, YaeF/YiiX, C92 family